MDIVKIPKEQQPMALVFMRQMMQESTAAPKEIQALLQVLEDSYALAGLYKGTLFMYGNYGTHGQLRGCLLITEKGHICAVAVHPLVRKQGIGKSMVEHACADLSQRQSLLRFTVNTIASAWHFFEKCGFVKTKEPEYTGRFWYLSMEKVVSPASITPNRKLSGGKLALTIGGGVLILILVLVLGFTGLMAVRRAVQRNIGDTFSIEEILPDQEDLDPNIPDEELPSQEGDQGSGRSRIFQETTDEVQEKFEQVPAHIEENLTFQVEEKVYEQYPDYEQIYGEYHIAYPQVSGLASGRDAEVNQILEDAAMINAYEISDTMREDLAEIYGTYSRITLGSKVEYKITYLTENLICVMFSDHYYQGDSYLEYFDLRARIIDLNTGTRYELEDVLAGNEELYEKFQASVLEKDPENQIFEVLREEKIAQMFTGEVVDGRYFVNLILREGGVDIGFTYRYDSPNWGFAYHDWATAPLTYEDIQAFESNETFWNQVRQ